jgi:hypothetical protein
MDLTLCLIDLKLLLVHVQVTCVCVCLCVWVCVKQKPTAGRPQHAQLLLVVVAVVLTYRVEGHLRWAMTFKHINCSCLRWLYYCSAMLEVYLRLVLGGSITQVQRFSCVDGEPDAT